MHLPGGWTPWATIRFSANGILNRRILSVSRSGRGGRKRDQGDRELKYPVGIFGGPDSPSAVKCFYVRTRSQESSSRIHGPMESRRDMGGIVRGQPRFRSRRSPLKSRSESLPFLERFLLHDRCSRFDPCGKGQVGTWRKRPEQADHQRRYQKPSLQGDLHFRPSEYGVDSRRFLSQ
jgi:hypothetical protein